ncbi:MAG TPA: 2,3-bisphosphoglycerate-independent phosphoglycerate mutase [Thermoanaerobaculia bacterium]|nr:2,3-bisphosphoglycerate-independent phosphoglycerate mutase [Thermoanaerobaculia bacterium]
MRSNPPFLILTVLDGFGCRSEPEWNAVAQARTPNLDRLFAESAWTVVEASGERVGLPPGQMGNSEVGHLNMGAGRVVDQDILRISKAVENSELSRNRVLVETFQRLERTGKSVHLVGLLSDGGVHSLQSHLHGLIDAAGRNGMSTRAEGMPSVFVHAILDGRDTAPRSAIGNVERLVAHLADEPHVRLSTIVGRYYSMDRDNRWERIKQGYDLMTLGIGVEAADPIACIRGFYEAGITDEFMKPIAVLGPEGEHLGKVDDGDTIVFFNFRADRMRQIVSAFRDPDFEGFERSVFPRVDLVSMVRYHEDFDFPVVFEPVEVNNHLGAVLAARGLRQLRIAETEKYAHVTFFFNGGSDRVFPNEERVLIPSPKVATYDLKPEMSVVELSERVVEEILGGRFGFIVLNIANPDMVGHTGVMQAAVAAVEATDAAVGRIMEAVEGVGGVMVLTADHGNCEIMYDAASGQAHTAHTTSPVPVVVFGPGAPRRALRKGEALASVAPTILEILGIEKPAEMTAPSLLEAGER